MIVDLSQAELDLLDKALKSWAEGMFLSKVAGESAVREQFRKDLLLRAKLAQASARQSEHEVHTPTS